MTKISIDDLVDALSNGDISPNEAMQISKNFDIMSRVSRTWQNLGGSIKSKPPSLNPSPQWFTVPSYNVSTEPHKIINRNGELVARFEDLDEAIRVAELWNREVGK